MHLPTILHPALCGALITAAVGCTAQPPRDIFLCATQSDCPPSLICAKDRVCRDRGALEAANTAPGSAGTVGATPDVPQAGVEALTGGRAASPPSAAGGAPGSAASAPAPAAGGSGSPPPMAAGAGAQASAPPQSEAAGADAPVAEPGAPLGAACDSREQCASGHCTEGRCCEVGTCPTCTSCKEAGICEQITDLSSALAMTRCAGVGGSCRASRACITGQCIDATCCTVSSCDLCHSCGLRGFEGDCATIRGADDPRGCSGARSCADGRCADVVVSVDGLEEETLTDGAEEFVQLAQTVQLPAGEILEVRTPLNCWSSFGLELRSVASDGRPSSSKLAELDLGRYSQAATPTLRGYPPLTPVRLETPQRIALVVVPGMDGHCRWWSSGQDLYADGGGYAISPAAVSWQPLELDFAIQVLMAQ
jgi:hypothetical protein